MAHAICPASGKIQFATKRDVLQHAASRRRRDKTRAPSYAYRCPDCRWWHLTRVPQERKPKQGAHGG